jgi:hypothetical protein
MEYVQDERQFVLFFCVSSKERLCIAAHFGDVPSALATFFHPVMMELTCKIRAKTGIRKENTE